MNLRTAALAAAFLLAAGCASVAKVESGQRTVGDRLILTLEGAWNHVSAPNMGPAQTWTMEGLPVDQLLVYSGIKDGQLVHGGNADTKMKSFAFRSAMQPEEIVGAFEGMLTRDGSAFKLVRLEPWSFGGGRGFRFEYSVVRRADSAQMAGVGYATVDKGELFALLYLAPRLAFFPRHKDRVESIARSAVVKG